MALTPLTSQLSLVPSSGISGPATGFDASTASAKRKAHRYVIDPVLASQIFHFYNEEEPLINVCKMQRFSLAFSGESHIEWGGGDIDPIILDSPSEKPLIEALFKRALEYRDMFGMVPVKLSRRAPKKSNNKPMIWIPPFGSGNFMMEYDPKTMETNVMYQVTIDRSVSRTSASRGSASHGKRAVVKMLDVFMWPGHEPSLVTKRFRSRIAALLPHYLDMIELRANLRDADFRASHPVVFTQSRPDNRSLQDMTEDELMGLTDEGAPGPDEGRHYSRNMHRAIQNEELAASMNRSAREPLGSDAVAAPIVRSVVDPTSRRVIQGTRSRTWDGAIQPLPHGEEMARLVAPQSRSDFLAFETKYEDLVCVTMGIPRSYIAGSVGSQAGSQRMRGESEQLRENVRAAVIQDRTDINLFYRWAYEKTHRSTDDKFMLRALLEADESERKDPSPEERARLAKIRANIGKIVAMPFRTRVVFSEDPLPKKVELPIIAAAASAGALSQLELINLLRAEMGLSSIGDDHELLKNSKSVATTPADLGDVIVAPSGATTNGAVPKSNGKQEGAPKKKKETKRKRDEKGASEKKEDTASKGKPKAEPKKKKRRKDQDDKAKEKK